MRMIAIFTPVGSPSRFTFEPPKTFRIRLNTPNCGFRNTMKMNDIANAGMSEGA